MKIQPIKILMMSLTICLASACGTQHDARAPTRANLASALDDFLAQRGDICLALFEWPIDVTEAEVGSGARHAVQFPVLEKLGLLHSEMVAVASSEQNPDGAVKRYELTDAGRRFYKPHPYQSRNGVEHGSDFCVAHIKRDRIVDVRFDAGNRQAVVSYTYRIEPAPWMRDADAQRVLPMITRVIDGAGSGLQQRQGFTLGEAGWVAQAGPV